MRAVAGGGAIGFDYRLSATKHTRAIHQASRRGNHCKFQHRASAATKRRESIRDNRGGLPSGEAAAYTLPPPPPLPPRPDVSRRVYTVDHNLR